MKSNEANYSQQVLLNGNRLRKEGQENPSSFAVSGGSVDTPPASNLDQKSTTRMAGEMGAFAVQLMSNPQLKNTVGQWNAMFAQSMPGMEFNQAKMLMAQGQQQSGKNDKKEGGGKENA